MRVYHFLNKQFGLEDIGKRRLKISRFDDLNDPFEFFALELSNMVLRMAMETTIKEQSAGTGLICFSRQWTNPVQWGHYADRHRGICLGLDLDDDLAAPVKYVGKRLTKDARGLIAKGTTDEATMLRLMCTKYAHWRYENEVRCFVKLRDKYPGTDLYFADFSRSLKLAQVIVGARSDTSRAEVTSALGSLATEVETFKARLAFRSFKVVRNKNDSLWH